MLGDCFCRVILFINWVASVQGLIKIPYFLPPLLQTSESNVPYLSLYRSQVNGLFGAKNVG